METKIHREHEILSSQQSIEVCDRFAREGWSLVQIIVDNGGTIFVFQRQPPKTKLDSMVELIRQNAGRMMRFKLHKVAYESRIELSRERDILEWSGRENRYIPIKVYLVNLLDIPMYSYTLNADFMTDLEVCEVLDAIPKKTSRILQKRRR